MRLRNLLFIAAGVAGMLVGAALAAAQAPEPRFGIAVGPPAGPEAGPPIMLRRGGPSGPGEDVTFQFIASEGGFDRRVVKGAPYSAEAITETVQTLADGNKISRQFKASIYRDSDGRTRREQTLPAIGPWAAAGEAPQTVFINDPVNRVNYVLDAQNKTARKLPAPRFEAAEERPARGRPGPQGQAVRRPLDVKTESLGERNIEGVRAEGARTTMVVPAGEIGNERPLEVVSERWYSPELQVVVMTKRSDPRMGESSYRLTNINRTEPLRSLFEVPPDYTVEEANRMFDRRLKTQRPAPGPRP